MRRKGTLPELLAPAGDMSCLIAAIVGGADAIYVGGMRFGARAYAKNFSDEELAAAVRTCHAFGVRLYVTLNTLILDKEINEALEYAKKLHAMGVDALIIADLGIMSLIRREVPELELHASTQMGVHNLAGADFAARMGATRVVLARECSAKDIRAVTDSALAECEVFLHGALCVCHSGQCLFSSMVGGRSGNRGECAQPCRLPYGNGTYPLSLKDLSLASHVRELIASGVASLKIEGRMKSPSYVYEVTKIYRTLLDEGRDAISAEHKRLADIFSRGGFTDGYYTAKIATGMTGIRSEDDKRTSKSISDTLPELPRIAVSAKAEFALGKPSVLTLTARVPDRLGMGSCATVSASVFGAVPSAAESSPITAEGLSARLSKLGATSFYMDSIDVLVEEGINLPPSAINALRRDAAEKLSLEFSYKLDALLGIAGEDSLGVGAHPCYDISRKNGNVDEEGFSSSLFFKAETLLHLLKNNDVSLDRCGEIFVPLFDYSSIPEEYRLRVSGVYLPPVISESEWQEVMEEVKKAESLGARYALIGNISHLSLISGTRLVPVGDFRLNVTNRHTRELYRSLGVCHMILSPELTLPQARDIGGAVITLGRIPLMITERCFIKENFGCERCGKSALQDRLGMRFPMMREYSHRNIIFNSAPTYMGDRKSELAAARVKNTHFIFSAESAKEISSLLESYSSGKAVQNCRRVGKREKKDR